jgi:hypothetical protein
MRPSPDAAEDAELLAEARRLAEKSVEPPKH